MGAVDFEELLLFTLVVHDRALLDELNLYNGISGVHSLVELNSELLNLLRCKRDVALYNVDVEVGGEVVHVGTD